MEASFLLAVFVGIYGMQALFASGIELINMRHAMKRGKCQPLSFQGFIDSAKFSQILAYTVNKTRIIIFDDLFSKSLLLVFILSGFPVVLEWMIAEWRLPYLPAGCFFILCPALVLYMVELPFDYYQTFVVEEKFGFNRSSLKTWIIDHMKTVMISLIVVVFLLSSILLIIQAFPQHWWLWAFLIVSLIQLLLAILYPKVIAPLFNKFEPIRDDLLSKRITRLMEENGIRIKKILQMDAGVRSRHTNAYFTGLGRSKQIVLYDTLIQSHPHDEILAILAHEIGHLKNKHILKQLLFSEISLFIGFYLTAVVLDRQILYKTFGFDGPKAYVGLFFIGILWQKVGFFLQPFYMALSRRFERHADRFSVRLTMTAKPLITALKRMAADNLSNLTPHPLFVWFHYSHPPLADRIALLEEMDQSEGHE
ncbi:MAG: M48 family metallopeptidase [Syntrophobacteraceae bacterium]